MHENDRMSPLVKAALIHSQFEMIHPFIDGNGLVGRLLIAFFLAAMIYCTNQHCICQISLNGISRLTMIVYIIFTRKAIMRLGSNFFLTGIIETAKEAAEIARSISAISIEEATIKLDISVATRGTYLKGFVRKEI